MYTKDTTNGTIVFHYPSADLFSRVSSLTLYKSKAMIGKGEQGDSDAIDKYGMTAGERDAFDIFMKRAATKVFVMVKKMTFSVTGALILDSYVDFGDTSNSDLTNQYAFSIQDNDAYNENSIQTVDDGIKDMLTYLTLADWWELHGLTNEAGIELAKYNSLRIEMESKRLFDLRKPVINSSL
jgi:hypothetical protein